MRTVCTPDRRSDVSRLIMVSDQPAFAVFRRCSMVRSAASRDGAASANSVRRCDPPDQTGSGRPSAPCLARGNCDRTWLTTVVPIRSCLLKRSQVKTGHCSRRRFLGMGVDVPRKCYRLRRCSLLSIWFDSAGARDGLTAIFFGFLTSSTAPSDWPACPWSGPALSRRSSTKQPPHQDPGWCATCNACASTTAALVGGLCCGRPVAAIGGLRFAGNPSGCTGTFSNHAAQGWQASDRQAQPREQGRHRTKPTLSGLTWRASDRQIQPMGGFAPFSDCVQQGERPASDRQIQARARSCTTFRSCVQHDGNGRHRTDKFNRGAGLHHLRGCGQTTGTAGIGPTNSADGALAPPRNLDRPEQPASGRQTLAMAPAATIHGASTTGIAGIGPTNSRDGAGCGTIRTAWLIFSAVFRRQCTKGIRPLR